MDLECVKSKGEGQNNASKTKRTGQQDEWTGTIVGHTSIPHEKAVIVDFRVICFLFMFLANGCNRYADTITLQ